LFIFMQERDPVRIGSILSGVVSDLTGGKPAFNELRQIIDNWEHLTERKIAQQTKVKGLRNHELLIDVASSSWATELSTMSIVLIERINDMFGKRVVRNIRFTVNPESIAEEDSRKAR